MQFKKAARYFLFHHRLYDCKLAGPHGIQRGLVALGRYPGAAVRQNFDLCFRESCTQYHGIANHAAIGAVAILILYGAIGSMATVDSALFSSSAIRAIKMIVLSLLYISLNRALAKLRVWLKHSAHRPIPISKATPHNSRLTA